MSEARFVILKEDEGDFVPFGHVARPLTLAEAKTEVAALARQYPDEKFHVFADCGVAIHNETVSVELTVPDLSTAERDALVSLKQVGSGGGARS
jgi:hypothetical protein